MPDVLLTQQRAAPTAGVADVWVVGPEQKMSDVWMVTPIIQTTTGTYDVVLTVMPTQFGVGVINNVQSVSLSAPVATASASSLVPVQGVGAPAPLAASYVQLGLLNTAEGGTIGVAPTVLNSGGGSGDAISGVAGAAGVISYQNDQAHGGSQSYKWVVPTSNVTPYIRYGAYAAATTSVFGGFYFMMSAIPSVATRISAMHDNTDTLSAGIRMTTSGTVRPINAANALIGTGSGSPIPLNQWVRFEWRCLASTTVGEIEWRVWWTNPEGGPNTTPDYSESVTGQVLGPNTDYFRVGQCSPTTQTSVFTFWVDDFQAVSTAWPGSTILANNASSLIPGVAASTPGITIAPPVATAAASSLVPIQDVGIPPAAATATASSPVPVQTVNLSAPVATATASSLVPTIVLSENLTSPAATAAASSLVPVQAINLSAPVSTATASSLVPVQTVNIPPPAATATASSLVPSVTTGVGVSPPAATATASSLVPTIVLSENISPPAATATATGPVPTIVLSPNLAPPVATATASGTVPVQGINLAIPAATAAASGLVPSIVISPNLLPPVTTATASSLVPVQTVNVNAVTATATGSAPIPTLGSGALIAPPAATALASALIPLLLNGVNANAPVATATASGLVPVPVVDLFPPSGGGGGPTIGGTSDIIVITSNGELLIRVAPGFYIS